MPNYVYNTIHFNPEDAEKVKALVCSDDREFDFNRIAPMPESLNICSGSCTSDAWAYLTKGYTDDLKKRYPDEGESPDPSYFWTPDESTPFRGFPNPKTLPELKVFAEIVRKNKDEYGCTDWYDWHCNYWGTKWNACDPCWYTGCDVSFDTAWSDPEPIYMELAKKLGITFTVECEEESLAFCSVTTYSPDGKDEEVAEGIAGLVLLGQDRDDIIDRYSDWYDEDEMKKLNEELDALGL